MKKIMGMGNALTDILVKLPSDDVLAHFGLDRGGMTLVDTALQKEISDHTADLPRALSPGGSAGNTIRAMARLGGRTGFTGKVGNDATGDFLVSALGKLGVEPRIFRGENPSGNCISLISSDGERTMATYLGAALEMVPGELSEGIFDGYDCLYIEGYLVQNRDLIAHAVRHAGQRGMEVAIDLASFNVVEGNLGFLRELAAGHIDIIFANEQEAHAFTGEPDPLRALDVIAGMCRIAVVKVGTEGAYIRCGDQMLHAGIMAAARRVDTTGAGDFYAAGFLYGLCEGLSLRQCATIGAICAGKVIEVVGTTFGEEVWTEIKRLVADVRCDKCLF